MAEELTQEDVFNDDKDPLEAIRELRKEEGSEVDEDLHSSVETDNTGSAQADNKDGEGDDDLGELDPDKGDADDKDGEKAGQAAADDTAGDDKSGVDDKGATEPKAEDDGAGKDGDDPAGDGEDGDDKGDQGNVTPKTKTFKANGQEFNFTEDEIMEQFETIFGQAMNYTQKMQKIAPYRKMISALEDQGLTQDQLNIAIDALKGDKGALSQIVKAHGIDAYDLGDADDKENTYQPTPYGKDETTLNIEEVSARISADKEYPITVDIIGKQWDQGSRDAFANNPQLIVGLHNDVKSGTYDEVAPVAMKMKVLDGSGKSDIEYYMLAGEQVQTQKDAASKQGQQKTEDLNQQTQDEVDKNEAASSVAKKKRSASSTRTRADRKGVIDYLDDDDEKFDDWYKNLTSSN